LNNFSGDFDRVGEEMDSCFKLSSKFKKVVCYDNAAASMGLYSRFWLLFILSFSDGGGFLVLAHFDKRLW
jgi:hypothetical protein